MDDVIEAILSGVISALPWQAALGILAIVAVCVLLFWLAPFPWGG